MGRTATLTFEGKNIELPVIEGTAGELGIDISKLRAKTGMITLDPGYGNTGACLSKITYIDGEKGILCHRGIPIQEFTKTPDFIDMAWMIMFGHMPAPEVSTAFRKKLTDNAHLHQAMMHHFDGFPNSAPPMAVASAMVNALSCFHPEMFDLLAHEDYEDVAAILMSKIRTIAAHTYRHMKGLPYICPDPALRYGANFLHMMFSMPYKQFVIDSEVEDALNIVLMLHADHEQNCSTSTVRMVGSSRANLFASVASGICALWGPLHGGANAAVVEMLEQIHKGGQSVEDYVERAKKKDAANRLMGFGHRVYKSYDPRATILKGICGPLLAKLNVSDPLLDLAMKLETIALADPYFIERKLYPNVDFYSGIILRALGIPTSMFPVMFTIGRLPGWIAHWKEQHEDTSTVISRPRQIYMGEPIKGL